MMEGNMTNNDYQRNSMKENTGECHITSLYHRYDKNYQILQRNNVGENRDRHRERERESEMVRRIH